MFNYLNKLLSLSYSEIAYILFLINFKLVYFIAFKVLNYNTLLKLNRILLSKKVLFNNVTVNRAFRINKNFRNFPTKVSCLHKSLCEKILLSYLGIKVHVNAGLKNTDKGIEGHAWISYKEKIIFEKKENIEKYQCKHRID